MSKPIHIDLAEHGFPEQWLDVDDGKFMSQRLLRERLDMAQNQTENFVRLTVRAWHVLDDAGEPCNDPATDDLERIPLGIMRSAIYAFVASCGMSVPKASWTL